MPPPRKSRKGRAPHSRHHDHSYRQLFSHPEMVHDLLTGFVPGDWVSALDLDTLEPVKASFVTDDFRDREDDSIWRVRWGGAWVYVYILIEFQSTVDPFMAVRIACYVSLLYQDLIARQHLTPEGTLPPVLPIVLYNGEARWTAPTELNTLVAALPGGLTRFAPHWSYLLLDEGAIARDAAWPPEVRNLVAALFQLEKARDEATWLVVYERLAEVLDSRALDSLKRAFGRWIYKSFIRTKHPAVRLPDIDDFHEVHVMLAQRVKQWNEEIREQGRREGHREGHREGREETRRETALAMIRRTDLDDTAIADLTGLTLDAVEQLRETPTTH